MPIFEHLVFQITINFMTNIPLLWQHLHTQSVNASHICLWIAKNVVFGKRFFSALGHSRNYPYPLHGENWKDPLFSHLTDISPPPKGHLVLNLGLNLQTFCFINLSIHLRTINAVNDINLVFAIFVKVFVRVNVLSYFNMVGPKQTCLPSKPKAQVFLDQS